MSKMIKTTDTNITADTTTILVVEIGMLNFELDERFPWVTVYSLGGESKEFIEEINDGDTAAIVGHEELKRFALNWYFNNVEIVEKLERTAQEVPVQEQSDNSITTQIENTKVVMSKDGLILKA